MNLDCTAPASWLLTIGVHAAIWSVVALGASLALRERALAWQEALLRLALVGGLLTGSVQWVLGGPLAVSAGFAMTQQATATVPDVGAAFAPDRDLTIDAAPRGAPMAATLVPSPRADANRSWRPSSAPLERGLTVAQFAVALAVGSALVGIWAFLRQRRRLWQCIASRRPEADARVLAIAASIAARLGLPQTPNLSRCDDLASPVAFGLLRPEICLPARTSELGDDELGAMFGHELAHVRRGDAFWLFVGALLTALLPWQLWLWPLRRRLCALAELRADCTAAATTSGLALANCLVQVAAWVGSRQLPRAALAMAARPSLLRVRVERALGERRDRALPRALAVAVASVLAALLTAMAPGVRHQGSSDGGAKVAEAVPAPIFDLASSPTPEVPGVHLPDAASALERELAELTAEAAAELAAVPPTDAADAMEIDALRRELASRLARIQELGGVLADELRRQSNEVDDNQTPAKRSSR